MAIDIDNLSVWLGRTQVVRNVSLSVKPGAVTAIVGPNGSGKTTLLRAVSGDLPFRGDVRINGETLQDMQPWHAAAHRAVLPQASSLSFPYTVREVVKLGLLGGRSGASPAEEKRLPEKALERVDLAGFAGRFYQELSGGEQQRVQLARVLCQVWKPVLDGQPRYLLLDEPVSSLDIKHQLIIMGIAEQFAASGGGVLAVLHDLNLTARFADQVAMMHRGTLVASGAPNEVFNDELVSDVFDCRIQVGVPPAENRPYVLPQSAQITFKSSF
ncbi:heme ABC transporter ATP-binding protein [Nitratireductor kimnyeongensis]|uniref:Heme ABC transporter ATP-binding protein n=1 Tax=Nitratireductor kimnyeongensis TaxID=430679 RepID=A0ABW0T4M9_9HYPH|nr:heme ABC transporter ATP-binding protein [Nitratireductor kimnyeongensis]QZZ35361.1 heme ABC transporter ATP-binding protein [Nitratireductor kimnyeongensis]